MGDVMKVLEYNKRLKAIKDEGNEILSRCAEEERERNEEEEKDFQRINIEMDRLEARRDDYIKVNRISDEEMRISIPERPEVAAQQTQGNGKNEKRAAFFKYIREGEQSLKPEQRALVEDSSGLYLVPQEMLATIYNNLPQANPIRKLATVIPTNVDKVLKRELGDVTMAWGKLETGAVITEGTPTPGQDTIYVEDLVGLVKIGKNMLRDLSDQSLENLLVQRFTEAVAKAENNAFVTGRGHSYQEPEGVAVDTLLISSTYATDLATADTIIPDDLIKVEYALPAQYLEGASFVMHRKAELAVRLVKQTYGPYLWQPSLQEGMPRTFDSYPIYNCSTMNYPADTVDEATAAIFGNWKAGYVILDRQSLQIQRLDELYAEAGLVGFLGHFRVGGGIVRHDAFRTLNNEST